MADNMADAGAGMGERVDEVKDQADGMMSRARNVAVQGAKQAKEYAQQGYAFAAEKGKQIKETTEGYIEENPWYAIGIALGVGVLVGLLVRGTRRGD